MICKTKAEGRLRIIDVDGKPLYPIAYMTYAPIKENIDAVKACGVRLFMFPIYAGDEGINMESGLRPICDNFFLGYGKYDFSMVDRVLNDIAPTAEEDVYIIPRVCLEPPRWWQKMHPEELSRDYRGEPQRESFSSRLWLEDMTIALYALIDHINASRFRDRVIGYHIAAGGTEEWAHHARYRDQFYDYSEVNLRAYHESLLRKYGTLENISIAHKKTYSRIEDVRFPTPVQRLYSKSGWLRDADGERDVLDFYDFHNESVADAICHFCRAVKSYTKGALLTGVFYGYVFSMPQNYKGLHALGRVLESPYVDFLSTTNAGIGWHFASAVESALMHGKMWICEGDIRTHKVTGMDKNLAHAMPDNDYYKSRVWRGPDNAEEGVWRMRKALARLLTAPSGIWWFDMFGGWYDDPLLLDVIKRSTELIALPRHELLNSEVALIVDEHGHKYTSLDAKGMPKALLEFNDALDRAGFPYNNYLLSDVLSESFPADKYKLIIFLAATNPTDAEIAAIKAKLKRDGKTLLFLGDSGAYAESLSEFKLITNRSAEGKAAIFNNIRYPENVMPTHELIDAEGYVLSRFEDGTPAVVWKECDGYNTVEALPLAIPRELISHIALLSGVHLFNRDGDIAYAGGDFIGIRASAEGYRRLCLPDRYFTAYDALSGETVTVNDCFIDMYLKEGEVRILRLSK